jgi:hypothetical protein
MRSRPSDTHAKIRYKKKLRTTAGAFELAC